MTICITACRYHYRYRRKPCLEAINPEYAYFEKVTGKPDLENSLLDEFVRKNFKFENSQGYKVVKTVKHPVKQYSAKKLLEILKVSNQKLQGHMYKTDYLDRKVTDKIRGMDNIKTQNFMWHIFPKKLAEYQDLKKDCHQIFKFKMLCSSNSITGPVALYLQPFINSSTQKHSLNQRIRKDAILEDQSQRNRDFNHIYKKNTLLEDLKSRKNEISYEQYLDGLPNEYRKFLERVHITVLTATGETLPIGCHGVQATKYQNKIKQVEIENQETGSVVNSVDLEPESDKFLEESEDSGIAI